MPMAKPRMDLTALVGKLLEEQDGNVLRDGVRVRARRADRTHGIRGSGIARLRQTASRPA
jgi:hypothetical protein